jgi:PBP1b-binding outer membrane lipoprotein LpoB
MRGAIILAALLFAGCAEQIAEHRVRSALVRAGLSESNADCMAERMVDRLTIAQLRKLEALQGEKRSIADYVVAVRRIDDAQVLSVTASSAALCATGLAR